MLSVIFREVQRVSVNTDVSWAVEIYWLLADSVLISIH